MSSGPDDRRDDPAVSGGPDRPGAGEQSDAQWQRPAPGGSPQAPDPTAVWTPGGPGLPPTLRWDGSGPPPGLPDPTQWTPAGAQTEPTQLSGSPWPDPNAPAPQPGSPQPGQPTFGYQPPVQPGTPWPSEATQLNQPAAGARPPAPQPGSPQSWPPGDRQLGEHGQHPGATPHPWQQDATPLGGYGAIPPTPPPGPGQLGAPWPGTNNPAGQQVPPPGWGQGASGGGAQQWNPAVPPGPGQHWAPGGQQYGEVPPLDQYGRQQYGQAVGGPKSGGKAAMWVGAGLAALLLGGVAITAVVLTREDKTAEASDSGATPSMVSALTTTGAPSSSRPKPSSTTPTPTGAASNRKPLIEGYQVVASPDRGAAYDVPPSWTVATETTIGGVGEPPGDAVIGKGYATDGRDYCPGSTRTMSLLTGSKLDDHAAASAELGKKAAPLAYSGSTGTPGPAQPLKSIDGKTDGMFTETTGTVPNPKPGCGPTYSIYTYAFKGAKDGSFVMVMIADTGVPDAVDAAAAKRIFSSIRAL
ncbi:hypothetical protein NN3_48260 [Nocardia neocaledoniensis NBRC 108232]|uniref:hypothetical protein n=1 Tax=Nocardia neocaledoniensis TaxID=236511 RepID=UPI00119236D5|nr:hypothetical protein [Nocardia neocaledoniensis]GEM33819.1 hypothetical protein NN3_48260 [Nocardia neocaledoniensis NBRC 108232]